MTALHRLFKPIRLLVVSILLASLLAGGLAGLALAQEGEGEPEPTDTPPEGDMTGEALAEECSACHPDVVAAWEGQPHDMAFADPLFQEGWADQNHDPACLECHTTGYNPLTGEYEMEGVTCVECHGETPEDHPPAPVDLNRANETCADCHLVSQAEFRASHHYQAGMECTSCHYAHNNGLRMGTELAQCLNCHADQLGGFVAHRVHIEEAELSCRDCHGYVQPGQEVPPNGLAPTGHDFQASLRACLDCHESIQLTAANGTEEGASGPALELSSEFDIGGQKAALRAQQLEAIAQTLLLQSRNRAAISMVQGGVGGLLVGGLAVWFVNRRKNGKNGKNGGKQVAGKPESEGSHERQG